MSEEDDEGNTEYMDNFTSQLASADIEVNFSATQFCFNLCVELKCQLCTFDLFKFYLFVVLTIIPESFLCFCLICRLYGLLHS